MSKLDELIEYVENNGLSMGLWSDPTKFTTDLRWDLRVWHPRREFGIREITHGETSEAAAEEMLKLIWPDATDAALKEDED